MVGTVKHVYEDGTEKVYDFDLWMRTMKAIVEKTPFPKRVEKKDATGKREILFV